MKRKKPFNLIYEAEWNDIPCVDYPLTPQKWASESIRPLVNTHVDALFYNLCSSDGYCCQLENGQILMDNFEKLGDAWVWRYRENTKRLIEAGANPPDMAVEFGRQLGIKVLPVVRMNDMHDMFFKYEVSQFKLDNPQLLLGHGSYIDWEKGARGHPNLQSTDSFNWGMFDFAHDQVREHRLKIIEEFIIRWDNDGVSLDFDRDPWLFRQQGVQKNANLITDLIRRVRSVLDEQSSKRGKPQYLHVRLLPEIEVCWERGMDVARWVNEGLVDAVSPGCGYMTFSLDLEPWMKLVAGKDCWIYPSVNKWKVPAVARAWAKLMYQRGAHGLYLFNWGHLLYGFDKGNSPASERLGTVWYDELHPSYYEALNQIGNPDAIQYLDSTYAMESIAHTLPEQGEAGKLARISRAQDAIALPIEMKVGRHCMNLPFAEDVQGARRRTFNPTVILRMKLNNYTVPDDFDVCINGTKLDAASRRERAVFIMNNDTWIEYEVDPDVFVKGNNELEIDVHSLNPQMSTTPMLMNVELVVKYVGGHQQS